MEQIFFMIFGFLGMIFAEGFISGFGLISLIPVVALLLRNRMDWKLYIGFIVATCLAFDVYNHYFLGTLLIALLSALLVIYLLQLIIPSHELIPESFVALIGFTVFHIILALLASIKLEINIGWTIVSRAFGAGIIEVIIMIVIKLFGNILWARDDKRLKLKK